MAVKTYIGNKEIKDNTILDEKLTDGTDLIEIEYVDGSKELLSKKMYLEICKTEPTDFTALRNNRIYPVSKAILGLLLSWGVKTSEVDYLFSNVTLSLNQSLAAAYDKKIGKKSDEMTLIDVDTILKTMTAEEFKQAQLAANQKAT